MRTQTLLIAAAAALAAAVTSSQAQTVYSANVVGYVNLALPANSFSLIGNQLDTGSNTVNNVLQSGFISNISGGSSGSVLTIFTGSGFNVFYYYSVADAATFGLPGGWYDGGGNPCTNFLSPTAAVFIQNPSTSNLTVTLTGQVDQGTNTWTSVNSGFNFYTEPTALAGTSLDNTNVSFPSYGSADGTVDDTYQLWTGAGYGPVLYYYSAAFANPLGFPAGWYDGGGNPQDANAADWPNVAGGFLIDHAGGTSNWVQSFEVQ